MKILVVEDERQIADFVRHGLEAECFTVEVCHEGNAAYELASVNSYDAIVLDIMLPGRDGLSILRNLRRQRNTVPVILLTARGEMSERVEGLDFGADDYITKPFFVEELIARLHAVIRRAAGESLSILQVADLTVNLITREVRRGAREIELTPREFNLLSYLMRSPDRVFSRPQIIEHVWEYYFDPGTNLVDVHIQRLRKKLCEAGEPQIIETVRGVGYRVVRCPEDASP
jgi:DNA-binding response OmpR family regulator